MPSPDVPKMPAGVDAEAKVVWRRVLRVNGAIRAIDRWRIAGRRRS
jgi:hypothetical protein